MSALAALTTSPQGSPTVGARELDADHFSVSFRIIRNGVSTARRVGSRVAIELVRGPPTS
jgi:hypothetical protein